MGTQENVDKDAGVNNVNDLVNTINNNMGVNKKFYQVAIAATPDDLANEIGFSIFDNNAPVIVGLRTVPPGSSTPNLNGWCYKGSCYKGKDGNGPLHIVMVYGFDFRSADNPVVKYFEPAGYYAGCQDPMYCPGKNTIAFSDFWTLVLLNDFVISGYPDICPGPNCIAR